MWVFNAAINRWQPLSGGGEGGGFGAEHGELSGLEDDDHPQYLTKTLAQATYAIIGHRHDHSGDLKPYNDSVYLRPQNIRPGSGVTIVDPGDGTIIISSTGGGTGGGGTDEVLIGTNEPASPDAELWVDTDSSGTFTTFAAGAGVTDHGLLTGRGDDDHPQYVLDTGDTMTGGLTLTGAIGLKHAPGAGVGPAQITVESTDNTASFDTRAPSGKRQGLIMRTGTATRWMVGTDATAEAGSNVGTDFSIVRYADNGTTLLGTVLNISRATGLATVAGDPVTALGVATKGYADSRVVNAMTSAAPTTLAPSQQAVQTYVDSKMIVSDNAASGTYPVNTLWIEY